MKGVQCSERAPGSYPLREITNGPGELHDLTARPHRSNRVLRIGQRGLRKVTEFPEAQEYSGGFDRRETGSHEVSGIMETTLDFRGGTRLDDRAEYNRGIEIEGTRQVRSSRTSSSILAAVPGGKPRFRTCQFHPCLDRAARVSRPSWAILSRASSRDPTGGLRSREGPSSATTSSRSVTRIVSPARARRTYSDRRAFSCLMPTALMGTQGNH